MGRTRLSGIGLLGLLAGLSGCGSWAYVPSQPGPGYTVYEAAYTQQSQFLAVVDPKSRSTQRKLPLGTPSNDWKHLYSVSSRQLRDIDPLTGAVLKEMALPGDYQLPLATISGVPGGLSQNGRWLVLEAWDGASNSPPSETNLLMVNTSFGEAPLRIKLQGFFDFDAVTNDGQRVYLIEYLSGSNYRVRIFDTTTNLLDPHVVVDKSDPTASMTGVRLSGVPSADGQWLYSVYARPDKGAFIHALSLSNLEVAFCIDLPGKGYSTSSDDFQWSLALSADGAHLYAVNGTMGVISDIETRGPDLARTVRIATEPQTTTSGFFATEVEAKAYGANAAVLSPDGKVLVARAASGIVWIDTADLVAHARALGDWRIWSLGLSPDGKVLYALNDAGLIAEVSMSSAKVGARFDPGAGYPLAIMRVVA